MLTGKHLIAGDWVAEGDSFYNMPVGGDPDCFHQGTPDLVNRAVEAAEAAFASYSALSRTERARFLRCIAEEIDTHGNAIIGIATRETGLPEARLQGERGRTVARAAPASLVRGSAMAIIDPYHPVRGKQDMVARCHARFPVWPSASNITAARAAAGRTTGGLWAASEVYVCGPKTARHGILRASPPRRPFQKHALPWTYGLCLANGRVPKNPLRSKTPRTASPAKGFSPHGMHTVCTPLPGNRPPRLSLRF